MQTKAENPATLLEATKISGLLRVYLEFNHLKQLYRQGWLRRGVPPERCESVAEHTLGVALLALWLADVYFPELDSGLVLRLALLHDFGEIYAGDIIPSDGVPPERKRQLERESVQRVFEGAPRGNDYLRLWEEFEAGESPEASFVRQIDRLEMGLQAMVYRVQGVENMEEFIQSAREALSDSELVELLAQAEVLDSGSTSAIDLDSASDFQKP
jgi:putative hydrolase of HD superfamily